MAIATPHPLSQPRQRRGRGRRLGVLAAVAGGMMVLLARGAAAPAPPQQGSGGSFATAVDFVHVDVSVTDQQGRFVGGLTLEDFEIDEDGTPQKVLTFAVVDLPPAGPRVARPTAAEAPPGPDVRSNQSDSVGRAYVIVLDDLHVSALRSSQAKSAAHRFVQ